MDGNYIITANGGFDDVNDLYHWGIKGMNWGVRRYQNADGSLTAAGRRRYTNKDGTLNTKGEKYYTKEQKRLEDERKVIENKKNTDAKLAKLDALRKANEELKKSMDPKQKEIDAKKEAESKLGRDVLNPYLDVEVANISTKDLTTMNNRMTAVQNFRTNMEKMGYTFVDKNQLPKSDIDYKIDDLKKKKELMSLEKDIKDLQPKKVNKGAEFAKNLLDKVVIPIASDYGKKAVEKYFEGIKTKEADKLAKKAEKEIGDQKAKVEKAAEKQVEKQAKKEEKAAEKQAEKQAKKEEKAAETKTSDESQKGNGKSESKKTENTSQSVKETVSQGKKAVVKQVGGGNERDVAYGTKAYKKEAEKLLAELDAKGWEEYFRNYKDRDD